jgi:hypothetical protein
MPKHAVICPWADEHSVDHGPNDTSTVLFEPSEGRAWGFKCFHSHCTGRTINDVLRKLSGSTPDALLSLKGELEKERNFAPKHLIDLLTDKTPAITWVLKSYLPEGALILLVAYMKVGKSTFAYFLAIAVARGEPFLGFDTTQGPVLILAIEEHPRDVKLRLLKFGARPSDPIHVHVGPLDHDARTFSALTDFIRKEGIRLVILDTLAQFWHIPDENDNSQVLLRITPLLTLARDTNASVLLIHHERKMGGNGGREIRGGSALLGAVDQALLLDHRQGGNPSHRVLRSVGRYDDTPRELILELVGFTYRALGTPDEVGLAAAAGAVADALSSAAHTIKTLVERTGLTDKQVRAALESLGDGVVQSGAGRKGDPFRYKRSTGNAIHSQAQPKGKQPKSQRTDTSR